MSYHQRFRTFKNTTYTGVVSVQIKHKVRITESEALHYLLVEALKDEFREGQDA